VGVVEGEARLQQTARDDTPALQQQFGVRAQREGAELSHPLRGGQPHRHAPRGPQRAHEQALRHRGGRGEIHRSGDVVPVDQELHRADEVTVVDPRHVLCAARDRPAETEPGQPQQDVEDAPSIGAHHHGGAQRGLAGARGVGLLLFPLPGFGDVDAVGPVARDAGFGSAGDTGLLVVGCVEAVGVDRGRAHLQPDAGRAGGCGDRLAHDPGGAHARVHHGLQIVGGVAAADAAAGQVHHRVAAVDRLGPGAQGPSVPEDFTLVRWPPAQHHDLVPGGGQRAVQDRTHLPDSPGYHDLHPVAPSWCGDEPSPDLNAFKTWAGVCRGGVEARASRPAGERRGPGERRLRLNAPPPHSTCRAQTPVERRCRASPWRCEA
jgi:hypothetical protein